MPIDAAQIENGGNPESGDSDGIAKLTSDQQ
jgi:hypothetical protein